jgi:hypothetical protein
MKKCSCTVSAPTTRVCVRTFLPAFAESSGRRTLLGSGAATHHSSVMFGVTLIWSPLFWML